ncbi:uncharacterized protein NPIL_625671 [Nephila pilipes]|uniref:Uncharacterized protein n=1 Tax=Nephila pilipes TaxID=299642 RepID=A0A8X6U1B2_NEPPI|nr:uncharacterized protein NPIL_625671 [Nephila pilipes]
MSLGVRLTSDGQPRSPSLHQPSSGIEQQQQRVSSSVVALSVHPTTRGQLLGSLHIAGSFGQWCPTFGGTPPSFSGKVRYAPLLQWFALPG